MGCCGFLWELMNGRELSSPVNAFPTYIRSKYSADLSSYKSACKKDLYLKSFDDMLHYRTNRIISSLGSQTKNQPINVESLMEVNGFLLQVNEEAVRVIIESRKDVRKNKDLTSLVDFYFKSTSKTLEFCNTVENSVKKTEISQLLIRFALKQFEMESVETIVEGSKKKKYAKTLDELNKFIAMGDPFDGEFMNRFKSVYEQQVLLLEELRKLKAKLEKKQRNLKTYKILTNVFFMTTLVSFFVLSVVSAATIATPVVGLIAAVLVPIENARNWCSKMWKSYEEAVKRQIRLVSTVGTEVKINNEVLNNINSEVENLRIKFSSILHTVNTAVEREEEEMMMSFQEIKRKVDEMVSLRKLSNLVKMWLSIEDTLLQGDLRYFNTWFISYPSFYLLEKGSIINGVYLMFSRALHSTIIIIYCVICFFSFFPLSILLKFVLVYKRYKARDTKK